MVDMFIKNETRNLDKKIHWNSSSEKRIVAMENKGSKYAKTNGFKYARR